MANQIVSDMLICPVCGGEGTYERHKDGWATCSRCGMEANDITADALEDCAPDEPFDEPLFDEPQPVINVDGLFPCPFCGGEAEVVWEINGTATVECIGCGALVDGIERWNRRAERTCHVEYGDDADWHLDCCGWTNANVAYCPWCGAKVMK